LQQRKIIRRSEVCRRTGYVYTSIWRLEREGKFPARVQLNPGATNGAVGWYEDEVDEWIHNRIRVAHKAERGASVTAEAAGTA